MVKRSQRKGRRHLMLLKLGSQVLNGAYMRTIIFQETQTIAIYRTDLSHFIKSARIHLSTVMASRRRVTGFFHSRTVHNFVWLEMDKFVSRHGHRLFFCFSSNVESQSKGVTQQSRDDLSCFTSMLCNHLVIFCDG